MTSVNQFDKLIPYKKDGLEIVINTQTGESFASIRAMVRMSESPRSTVVDWISGRNWNLKEAEIQTGQGIQGVRLLNEAQICKVLARFNPELLATFAEAGVRVFLHTLAGYQVKSTAIAAEHPLEKARTIYVNRMTELEKTLQVPEGYWTVIQECGMLMLKIERMGYPIDAYDMLDGSIGLTWSNYRKSQDWVKPTAVATLKVNQSPKPVEIKAYDFMELAQFRPWFQKVYQPTHMPKYLNKKYGELLRVKS